jgi:8-oxo-dGTP diphosphatase
VRPEHLRLAHVMHRNDSGERIALFFTADTWEGEPRNIEPEKHEELAWFSVDALPEVIPYMRSALSKAQEGTIYSEFGW